MAIDRKEKKKIRKKREHIILFVLAGIVLLAGLIFIVLLPNKEKWVQEGKTISKGDETYKIGDYYEYDETSGGKLEGLTDTKWKVLGVNDKGNLLIVSASSVETINLGKKDDINTTQKDYLEGIDRLNEIAEKYGHGESAISARSINLEDINKITKYNTEKSESYNVKTTYYWGEGQTLKSQTEGKEMVEAKVDHNNRFIWFNESTDEWITNQKDENKTYETPEEIVTLQHTQIMYNNLYYDAEIDDYREYLDSESQEYKMLFVEDNGEKANYIIANRSVVAKENYAGFGYNVIRGEDVNYTTLLYSSGNIYEMTSGVRVVVTID